MRKELLKRVMVADRHKKGLAVLMSLALAATAFSVAPSSEAAAKTTPSLSAKKKTLYYNGTKKFTLKVKKNKAKKIVKTTWKTSNKKVAAISKKKKTSVVVTAKKKGTAKITATVSYKAGSKTKKVKLTCKVTSKKKSGNTGSKATPTPKPTTKPTTKPTQKPTPTPTPAGGYLDTLEGNGSGDADGVKSKVFSLKEKNSKVTIYVEALSEAHAFIDLNQGNNFITLATDGNAWDVPDETAEELNLQKVNEGFCNFQEGGKYTIIITRKDYVEANENKTDYEIVIKNTDTGDTYVTLTAKDTVLQGDVSTYLKVVWGKIKISDSVLKSQPQSHGTDRTRLYSLSDVNNVPPTDYTIPDVVRDAKDKAYEKYFPKDAIQTVKVEIDEGNLNYMLQHAEDKPSVMTNSVKIGDAPTLKYAGIKTKGNYTLAQTNASTSDRFSFTLNFGKYIKKKDYGKKQNFYGCNKISFNNCFFDKTIMKEYNAMRLMDEMGIPTPQYSLAKLYINNQYYGVYFMVEAMDSAIIERNQDVTSKDVSDYLVKPSYTHMQYNFENELERCLVNNEFTMESLEAAGLNYNSEDKIYWISDDSVLWNYRGIWEDDFDTLQDVAKMIPTVLTWNRKVQLLSNGKDFSGNTIDVNSENYMNLLKQVMDPDEAVKYFATHSFLVQMDNMFTWGQNYGLYVSAEGKSLLVPWDYDLAWGTAIWDGGSITSEEAANWDIDKMYPGNFTKGGDVPRYDSISKEEVYKRAPVFNVIWQNTELKNKYHEYMDDCAKLVSLGGTLSNGKKVEPARFAKTIEEYYSQVTDAAKINLAKNVQYLNDIVQPKGTQEGIPTLKKLIARRAVGVWLQKNNIDAKVTGYDCDILKLGANFDKTGTSPSVKGKLAVVDETTGIFATVTYPNGNNAAWIRAQQLTSGTEYTAISAKKSDPLVYKIELANAANLTECKLYIPVSSDRENAKIYSYSADTGNLTELTAETIDDVYCVTGTGVTYIVIAQDN